MLLLSGTVLDASTLNAFERILILTLVPLFFPCISYCISYRDNQISIWLSYMGLLVGLTLQTFFHAIIDIYN